MIPKDCPKFDTCNAPICPLDTAWRRAVHLQGERTCHYLVISGKDGVDERYPDDPVLAAVRVQLPMVLMKHPTIRRVVGRAMGTGFKEDNLKHPSSE